MVMVIVTAVNGAGGDDASDGTDMSNHADVAGWY
jgi:hypothetical protein